MYYRLAQRTARHGSHPAWNPQRMYAHVAKTNIDPSWAEGWPMPPTCAVPRIGPETWHWLT
jgi:hypothetical protein